ncbi:hypothetical protein AgCh_017657 [Apium graveolens]
MSMETINGKDVPQMTVDSYSAKFHNGKKEKPCLNELFDVMYITITHHNGSSQILKLQRDEKRHDHRYSGFKGRQCSSAYRMTSIPSKTFNQEDKKLKDYESSIERECRAVGQMTLKPSDGSGSDFVYPFEAEFYVKYRNTLQHRPSRFQRAFACFLFSSIDVEE